MIQQQDDRQYDSTNGNRTAAPRWAAAVIGAALVLTTLGCEEQSQANATIAEASHMIAAVNAGGGGTVNAPHREETYDRVIGLLRPVVSSSNGATKGSAQVITAQAMAGKGRIEGVRAARMENQCSSLISAAHNAADLFAAHASLGTALVAYDMQPEFDEIRTRTNEINDEIESVRARTRSIDDRIAQLQQRADVAREEAATRHRHETELRSEAVTASAAERQELIREAVGYQREADAFEAEYVMIEAGIEQLRDARESVQADLDRLVTQRTLLEEADENAQRRATAASDESKSAGDAAFESARDLRTIVREIETLRTGSLNDTYNVAESTLDSAVSTLLAGARADSSKDGKDSNNVTAGLMHQALGELRKSRATGSAGYVALLERLADLEPSLPDRNDYVGMLSRAQTGLDSARAAADEAFAQAADVFERTGGSEATRERLERIATSMRPPASDESGTSAPATDGTDG